MIVKIGSLYVFVEAIVLSTLPVIESIALPVVFNTSSITQPENVKATVVAKARVENLILYPLIFRFRCLKIFDFLVFFLI